MSKFPPMQYMLHTVLEARKTEKVTKNHTY